MKYFATTIAILVEVEENGNTYALNDKAEAIADLLNEHEGGAIANWGYANVARGDRWPDDYWTQMDVDPDDANAWDFQGWIDDLNRTRIVKYMKPKTHGGTL